MQLDIHPGRQKLPPRACVRYGRGDREARRGSINSEKGIMFQFYGHTLVSLF